MRADQIAERRTHGGLNLWGRRLVNNWFFNNGHKEKECVAVEVAEATYRVSFEDIPEEHHLLRYTLANGSSFSERVQEQRYLGSFDHHYSFLSLEDETGKLIPESVWSQDEMESMDQDM